MDIVVYRYKKEDKGTSSRVSIDGVALFEGLELPISSRSEQGYTAVPTGRYLLELGMVAGKCVVLPRLLGVPRFPDAYLHGGSLGGDPRGVLQVGMQVNTDGVFVPDTVALEILLEKMCTAASLQEVVWLLVS